VSQKTSPRHSVLSVDYIEKVTGEIWNTKACLCRRTVTVVMEQQQNHF